MSALWRREEFLIICSTESLAKKAKEIEVTETVIKGQEQRYNLNPVFFFIGHSWGRRLDGIAIIEALQIIYILELERSTDKDEEFLQSKLIKEMNIGHFMRFFA